jgi:hypothetical protein
LTDDKIKNSEEQVTFRVCRRMKVNFTSMLLLFCRCGVSLSLCLTLTHTQNPDCTLAPTTNETCSNDRKRVRRTITLLVIAIPFVFLTFLRFDEMSTMDFNFPTFRIYLNVVLHQLHVYYMLDQPTISSTYDFFLS